MTTTYPTGPSRAASERAILVERAGRVRFSVEGPDRAKFLHNLTTQDVKRLAAGEGREAFVTSPQGRTLGHVTLLAGPESIRLLTDAASLDAILPHLRKYGVFEEVTLRDETPQTFEIHLAGPRASEVLRAAGSEPPDDGELRHRPGTIADVPVQLFRESPTGRPGITIVGPDADAGRVSEALRAAGEPIGLESIGTDAFEALRIEGGYPSSGRDVTPENLPQEVGRDAAAISFVKGCYLGQETVARLDALGHVNRLLRGLRLPGSDVPPVPGAAIECDGKKVGAVTSAAYSTGWGCVLALGYLRTTHAAPGTVVRVGDAEAVVCDLPMLPPV